MERRVQNLTNMVLLLFLVVAMLSVFNLLQFVHVRELKQQVVALDKRQNGYEQRTVDVLTNWDSMRKTQLVILELLGK